MKQPHFFLFLCVILPLAASFAFFQSSNSHLPLGKRNRLLQTSTNDDVASFETETEAVPTILGVVAPLKYLGPYPCLSLRFPNLATIEQRNMNDRKTGVVLDFVLDTGANVNSIDAQLCRDFALSRIFVTDKELPIVGSGRIGYQSGEVHLLGDCELEGLPPGQNFTFMTNLTAAALPHASPVGQGLLGLSFFSSIPSGVELDWHGTDGDPPTVIFYFDEELHNQDTKTMTRLPLKPLGPAQVLSLDININGKTVPALLDTGSPITVISRKAAEKAGIETVSNDKARSVFTEGRQDFGDEVLTVGGVTGGHVTLQRSKSPVPVRAGNISLGREPIYVGDLPCLDFLENLGIPSPPAAVLGLDSLRRTYRMILRASKNEVWFEELDESKLMFE